MTPEGVEVPHSLVDEEMQARLKETPKEYQPSTPPGPDPERRYMWGIGSRPSNTRFQELNSEPVVPVQIVHYSVIYLNISSEAVAEMAAIGFGLPKDAFTSHMKLVWDD